MKFSFSQFILRKPLFYWSYQKLVGGDTARRLFIKNHVKPIEGAKLLDLGCGPGNILDFLPDNMDYYGFDIETDYIEAAKKKYGKRGKFICTSMDEFKVPNPGTFDIAIAIGVIHHLNDIETKNLFKIASQALKPSGRLITFDGCYTKNQNIIAYLMLKFDRGKYVRKKNDYENLAFQSFSKVNSIIDKTYFHLPYTSIIMECRK